MLVFDVPVGELDKVLERYGLGEVDITKDVQQTLALLTGTDDISRKVLRTSETGVLNVCSARIVDIIHVSDANVNYVWSGDTIPVSECLVLSHPDNAGRIWVRPDKAALSTNAFPLDAGDGLIFSIDNLKNVHAKIESANDILIVIPMR